MNLVNKILTPKKLPSDLAYFRLGFRILIKLRLFQQVNAFINLIKICLLTFTV